MSKFDEMTDEYLLENYVPDVYQKSIYAIDYDKLKNAGIKLLTFDIDDTIVGIENFNPDKRAITLFTHLTNKKGFFIVLLTNTNENRAERFARKLGLKNGSYIANAEKPLYKNFQKALDICREKNGVLIQKEQMAHIGNSMTEDVAGGKTFGITTCLVRRAGNLPD